MDIVICVSIRDCFIAQKSIYYIRQNIKADQIYIITEKRNFSLFSKKFLHRYNVTLIDERKIIPNRQDLEEIANRHFTCRYSFGWYYQQFLKMGFALTSYAKEFYLIWDADTIPLNKLLFNEQGKMIFTSKTEHHKAYFETMRNLIGYTKEVPYSFIAEHMIVSVTIMQTLIEKIGKSEATGKSWVEKIINATPIDDPNGFSEFETYGTYCHHNFPGLFTLRKLRTFREAGSFYSRGISKRALCKLSAKYDTISLESWSIPYKYKHRLRNKIEKHIIGFIQIIRKYYPSIPI